MTEHTNGSLALIFPADGSSAQLVRFDVSKERLMEGVMSSLTIYRIYCYVMGMPSLDDASRIFYIGYVKNSKLPGSIGSNKIASHGVLLFVLQPLSPVYQENVRQVRRLQFSPKFSMLQCLTQQVFSSGSYKWHHHWASSGADDSLEYSGT